MEGGVHFSRGGTSTGAPAPLGCILSLLDSTSAAHFPPPSRLSEQTGPTRLWSRRMCIHLLLENSKIAKNCLTTISRRIPLKKDTPCLRAKEKPQGNTRRGEIVFRVKPHTPQRCSEGSNKTLCAPGPRDPTRD